MKQNDYLKYINYPFKQSSDVFKINTDTAVLGMFLDDLHGKSVLDIGTGSGALLLYAHYRHAGRLIGVDIQEKALKLAEENVSAYTKDYEFIHSRIQDLKIDPVDIIICNPPFYETGNMRKDDSWNKAMFEETMSLDEMFDGFRRNLKDNGAVYVLYPAERFPEFYDACIRHKMKIMKLRFIHDEKRPYASRIVARLKIGPMKKLKVLKPLIVRKGGFEH
ncbi:MAG: methyltransferase domain-containing protein [Erysipelotrichaceae bacterium]|nr:methyltransferase domain-containing protein [Erysipelotrichaceae bacterium]